jgi:hypothetical protein
MVTQLKEIYTTPTVEAAGFGSGPLVCGGYLDLGGSSVWSETAPAGVAKPAVRTSCPVGDFCDESGFHPVCVAGVFAGQRVGQRWVRAGQRLQSGVQVAQHRVGKPGADLPRVHRSPCSLCMPSSSDPIMPRRQPAPGFQPTTTNSWVRTSGTLTQSRDRLPGWYREVRRLAITPSRPLSEAARRRSAGSTSPRNASGTAATASILRGSSSCSSRDLGICQDFFGH